MEQEVENKENGLASTGESSNVKKYDVFISYRRVPRVRNDNEIEDLKNNDFHHSTSLARAIALEYTMQGLDVYYDCGLEDDYIEALRHCKNIIVLLAEYSFNSNIGTARGENFRNEIGWIFSIMRKKQEKVTGIFEWTKGLMKSIKEIRNSQEDNKYEQLKSLLQSEFKDRRILKEVKKKSIYWIDIDGRFGRLMRLCNNRGLHEAQSEENNTIWGSKEDAEWLKTIQTIKQLYATTAIKPIEINTTDQELTKYLPKIKKCPRFSFKTTKVLSWLFAVVFVALAIITPLYHEISQPGALFVGGGTVKAYLLEDKGIDVENYAPNSKYIHLPSGVSSSVLQDIVNEESCHYYPILLSTGKLDYDPTWMNQFKESRMILQVSLDSVPLMVQLRNCPDAFYKGKNSISVNNLRTLIHSLDSNSKDQLFITSITSGTYNRYKSILNIDEKSLRVKPIVFNQRKAQDAEKGKEIKVLLANERYYYGQFQPEVAKEFITLSVYDSTGIVKIPLYAYAATEKLDPEKTTEVEISRPVLQFIHEFNDTIKAKHPMVPLEDGIFLIIDKKDK